MKLYTAEFEKQCLDMLQLITSSNNIVLAPHQNPDGDAIGSILGFAQALKDNEQKNAVLYSADPVPRSFDFLSGYSDIIHAISWRPDLLIGFDYGDFARLGVDQNMLQGSQIACFDHHPLRNQVGDVCIITTSVASTTELLYHFMKSGWLAYEPANRAVSFNGNCYGYGRICSQHTKIHFFGVWRIIGTRC